jgi:hypothetical protein
MFALTANTNLRSYQISKHVFILIILNITWQCPLNLFYIPKLDKLLNVLHDGQIRREINLLKNGL